MKNKIKAPTARIAKLERKVKGLDDKVTTLQNSVKRLPVGGQPFNPAFGLGTKVQALTKTVEALQAAVEQLRGKPVTGEGVPPASTPALGATPASGDPKASTTL